MDRIEVEWSGAELEKCYGNGIELWGVERCEVEWNGVDLNGVKWNIKRIFTFLR